MAEPVNGLLRSQPVLNGLLGPARMNPNLQAQGRNALASSLRGTPSPFLDPEFYSRDLGPSAARYFSDPENALRALSIAPVPVLSDAAGLAADALMYKNKPESRNMLNFGLTGLGALPLVPAMAGIFAGTGAKTADIVKLNTAKQLAEKGESAESIWQKTGWFKGPEGKWKFEIDDSAAKMTPQPEFMAGYTSPQAMMMKHPDLYQAYPKLQNIRVGKLGDRSGAELQTVYVNGVPDFNQSQIGLGTGAVRAVDGGLTFNADKAKSMNLHELQHAIQGQEGFAKGGSATNMAVEWSKAKNDWDFDLTVSTLVREANASTGGNLDAAAKMLNDIGIEVAPEHIAQAMRLGEAGVFQKERQSNAALSQYGDLGMRFSGGDPGRQLYKRLAGEAEARAVQSRMDMTPQQRQEVPPWQSYDVPWDKLIIR